MCKLTEAIKRSDVKLRVNGVHHDGLKHCAQDHQMCIKRHEDSTFNFAARQGDDKRSEK